LAAVGGWGALLAQQDLHMSICRLESFYLRRIFWPGRFSSATIAAALRLKLPSGLLGEDEKAFHLDRPREKLLSGVREWCGDQMRVIKDSLTHPPPYPRAERALDIVMQRWSEVLEACCREVEWEMTPLDMTIGSPEQVLGGGPVVG
ncbi:unnamed protein product, partial [Chrysoparadoxa australica]